MDIKNTNEKGKKTWSNYYWFYYKWHIFFIALFGLAIIICTAQCAARVTPDCYVLFNSNIFISDQELNSTADELEKYIDDINGDGKIEITAINCTYPKGNETRKAQVNQQAVLQMQSDNTHIWVVDEKGIELYLQNDDIDIFASYKCFDSYNKMALSVENIPALKWLNENNQGNKFYILARKDKSGEITDVSKKIISNIAD